MSNLIEGPVRRNVPSLLNRLEYIVGLLGAMILIVFWLVIATFPSFFFFNPIGTANTLRRVELVFSTVGWILISTGAPLVLFSYSFGKASLLKLLPLTALVYPLSLLVSQVTIYAQTGSTYISYLTHFPIFIFTDLLLPILILVIWRDLRNHMN